MFASFPNALIIYTVVAADGQALGQGPPLFQRYQDLCPGLAQDGHACQVGTILSSSSRLKILRSVFRVPVEFLKFFDKF